jgi:glycosyltransferase involved in cell wall biosynthesis
MLRGAVSGYPVYRPPVDHTVSVAENRHLPTTFAPLARIVHRTGLPYPRPTCPEGALIEFEHGFGLINLPLPGDDYLAFVDDQPKRLHSFLDWYDPERHRLVGTSREAVASALGLFLRHDLTLAERGIEQLYWSTPKTRYQIDPPCARLEVFHYGGMYPYAKGTHDVIAVARRCRTVQFNVSVDASHPLLSRRAALPANLRLLPMESRRLYDEALQRSHLCLCPLYADGWGTPLEALGAALPLVIYDSYDKSETVIPGETGELITLEKSLSLYDGFYQGNYRNWEGFNRFIADSSSALRVERLADAVMRYDDDRQRLVAHSRAAGLLHDRHHAAGPRLRRLRQIYRELLAALDQR